MKNEASIQHRENVIILDDPLCSIEDDKQKPIDWLAGTTASRGDNNVDPIVLMSRLSNTYFNRPENQNVGQANSKFNIDLCRDTAGTRFCSSVQRFIRCLRRAWRWVFVRRIAIMIPINPNPGNPFGYNISKQPKRMMYAWQKMPTGWRWF